MLKVEEYLKIILVNLFAYTNHYGLKTTVEAEALALLDGLQISKQRGIHNIWVELYSLLLTQMIQKKKIVRYLGT